MSSAFKTKQFKELRAHWYQRLEESGFEDIEDLDSPLELLKTWHSNIFRKRHSIEDFVATQEYYAVATSFFYNHDLTPLQREIWQLHCDGLPFRKIAETLNERGFKTNKDTVNACVAGLSALVRASFSDKRD